MDTDGNFISIQTQSVARIEAGCAKYDRVAEIAQEKGGCYRNAINGVHRGFIDDFVVAPNFRPLKIAVWPRLDRNKLSA